MKTSYQISKFSMVFFLSMTFLAGTHAQETITIIDEGDVPAVVIVKHFRKYENCQVMEWAEKTGIDGHKRFVALFNYQGNKGEAVYLSNGRVEEETQYFDKIMPAHIYNYVSRSYDKFKFVGVKKVENFANEMTYFVVQVKSKEKGIETFYFDELQNIKPQSWMYAYNN